MLSVIRSWFSWFWPITEAHEQGRHGGLEVCWERGRKVLNSAHGNQSFGSLHHVWQQAFDRINIRQNRPQSVLILGLGGGSAVHILRSDLAIDAPISAVEYDPVMIQLAREHFGLDQWSGLSVLEGDALIQVHALPQRYDLVVVDLFEDLDMARGVDHGSFIHGLRDRCAKEGTVLFNTVAYDRLSSKRCDLIKGHLDRVFHSVEEYRTQDVNRVFIAR